MNRIVFKFCVLAFAAFFSYSCDSKKSEAEFLELNEESIVFEEKSDFGEMRISSNTKWTITCSDPWITSSQSTGEGSNWSIRIFVTANDLPDVRTGSVTVRTQGGIAREVQVIQGGTDPFLIVTPSDAEIYFKGENLSVYVAASGAFTVQIPDDAAGWVSTSSVTERHRLLTVAENTVKQERSTVVTIKLNGEPLQKTIVLLQQARPDEPVVESFPQQAGLGTGVVLTGTNLNYINKVFFGKKEGVISNQTGESMTVTVPINDVELGLNDLTIIFFDNEEMSIGQIDLIIIRSVIDDLPAEAGIGKTLTLTGTNLRNIGEIWFGDARGTILSGATETEIRVTTPVAAEEGEVDVEIIYFGIKDVIGQITLISVIPENLTAPERGFVGDNITITGDHLDLVNEVWFGSARGTIVAGRTENSMDITIPNVAPSGAVDLKFVYLGNKEMIVKKFNVRTLTDFARFAGSDLPGVPTATAGREEALNTGGGRNHRFAFDGYVDASTALPIERYRELFGTRWANIGDLVVGTITYWQANSGCTWGDVGLDQDLPTNRLGFVLNYSQTPEKSVTFDRIVLHARDAGVTRQYVIDISDNGSNWERIIFAQDSYVLNPGGSRHVHQLDEPVTAKYVRYICVLATAGNTGLRNFSLYNTKEE